MLVVDSQTVADPLHPASHLATDPDGIAAAYDLVIATPAIAAGLSVTLRGHFAAVFGWGGGTTDPAAVVQALARVRDDCPRHLYAPERSPGSALRLGCGSTDPATVFKRLDDHAAITVAQILSCGWDPENYTTGPWLPLWARLAAMQNGQRLAYRATVLGLLEREGYRLQRPAALSEEQKGVAQGIAEELKYIATTAQAAEDQAVIEATVLTAADAAELAKRSQLSPSDRAKLQRYRVATAWGLGATAPTTEVLEGHRNGLHRRLRFGWLVKTRETRALVELADEKTVGFHLHRLSFWVPDLCEELELPKLRLCNVPQVDLQRWLERNDWFDAGDSALLALQAFATERAAAITQMLGISIGKRATTTLRQLLALGGYRLKTRRRRRGAGRLAAAEYEYRVVREALPAGASISAMEAAWGEKLLEEARCARGLAPSQPMNGWPWLRQPRERWWR